MAFNSIDFVAFFPIVLAGYHLLPRRVRWAWLLGASLYFYAAAVPAFLLQVLAVTGVVYVFGRRIESAEDPRRRSRLLYLGVGLLIANLFAFKYVSFANETLRGLAGLAGLPYPAPVLRFLLPLGISFYTFQLIGYLVDVSRKAVPAERHLGVFALFVLFFPKVVAGPIERAKNLLPQLHAPQSFDYRSTCFGLQLMLWGAFKKAVVGDRLAPLVRQVYDDPANYEGPALATATVLFAVQLYCDFSGYSDLAIGSAQCLGVKLTPNFNRPYAAISVQDYWKRWHISLTSWLTDYVYTPLTRNKRIKVKWYTLSLVSMFVTFVLSGLWHGAAWTFVVWGALHGAYLVTSMQTQKQRRKVVKQLGLQKTPRLYNALRVGFVFCLICIAYVLFEARSLSDALYILSHLPTGWGHAPRSIASVLRGHGPVLIFAVFGAAVVFGADYAQSRVKNLREAVAARPPWQRWSLYYALALSFVWLGAFWEEPQKFIYFQF